MIMSRLGSLRHTRESTRTLFNWLGALIPCFHVSSRLWMRCTQIRNNYPTMIMRGPSSCFLPRIGGFWRWRAWLPLCHQIMIPSLWMSYSATSNPQRLITILMPRLRILVHLRLWLLLQVVVLPTLHLLYLFFLFVVCYRGVGWVSWGWVVGACY